MKMKYVPNIITSLRIAGTIGLAFCDNYSELFYIVFTLCGLSDVVDGCIARMTRTVSKLGEKLDSIADLLFYSVMGVKLLPDLIRILPLPIWFMVTGILVGRVVCYVVTALRFRCFASMHTYMNKLTGFAVFTIPYTIVTDIFVAHSLVIGGIAILSTLEEFVMTLMMKDKYEPKKTIFAMNQKKLAA